MRAVARLRETLLAEQTSLVQRMQRVLVQMNIQLNKVLTKVMGMSCQAIIRDINAGECCIDPVKFCTGVIVERKHL